MSKKLVGMRLEKKSIEILTRACKTTKKSQGQMVDYLIHLYLEDPIKRLEVERDECVARLKYVKERIEQLENK